MKRFIPILVATLAAFAACAQPAVTTVDTMTDFVSRIRPSTDRPSVRVLGGSAPNDGGGGEFVWRKNSTVATNTLAEGGPFAYPFGSSEGRWEKRVDNQPVLKDPTLTGTTTIPDGAIVVLPSGATFVASSGSFVLADRILITRDSFTEDQDGAAATRIFVKILAPAVVDNLAALKALAVNAAVKRVAIVLSDTGNDAAAGDWYWDPTSFADTTAVCVASDLTGTGRWFKR